MKYETLENNIHARLTADLGSNIEVSIMPESQAQFSRPFTKPRVEICYKSSDFDKPQSINRVSQNEISQLELVIIARLRRGNNGLYDVIEKVKDSIVGYQPDHYGRVYFKTLKPEDFKDNLWYYTLTIETPTLIVENYTELDTPLFVAATSITNVQ